MTSKEFAEQIVQELGLAPNRTVSVVNNVETVDSTVEHEVDLDISVNDQQFNVMITVIKM